MSASLQTIDPRVSARPKWTALFALLLLFTLSAVLPAMAAPGTLYANGVTGPQGLVWLPGALGGHLWVSDGARGFCRLDAGGAGGTFNLAACDAQVPSPTQVVEDPRANGDGTFYLYVADRSTNGNGVIRLRFNPATETIVAASSTVLAGGSQQRGLRSNSVAYNPVDNNLYVGFIKSANIVRITTPNAAAQTAVVIGTTADGRKGTSGGMVVDSLGNLFLSEKAGMVTSIAAVQQCETVVGGITIHCGAAELTAMQSFFPNAIAMDGSGRLLVGEAPATATAGLPASVLRYNVATDVQDVMTSTHPALPDGTTQYKGISALAVAPNGDLYIGDDATLGAAGANGHLWIMPSAAAPDALGAPGLPALAPPPPAAGPLATMVSWGHQAPNGFIFLPGALGGHLWAADESGLCRIDTVSGVNAINVEICDPGSIGTPASPALDPTTNPDGTRYLYVPEIDRFSAGVWRLKYDPSTETIQSGPELMVPYAQLGGMRPNAVAYGPDGNLYVTGKSPQPGSPLAGGIFRITGPAGPIRLQQVTRIGSTSDGRGTNGSMAFVGSDLYLPENNDLGVIRSATTCNGACTATAVPLVNVFFGAAVATDGANVYVANSPGAAPAIIVRYTPASGRETVLINGGALPAGLTATTNVTPSFGGSPLGANTRTVGSMQDPYLLSPSLVYPFRFILAMYVDASGNMYFGDDPFAGARAQRGHTWVVPSVASIP